VRRPALPALLGAAVALAAAPARGDADAAAPGGRLHGSVGAGGALLFTGDGGDRLRTEVAADLKLGGRYGVLAAWRAADDRHRGLAIAGLVFEGAAARPRLVLDLHAGLGVDLDAWAPLAGGGLRATLRIVDVLGVVFDSGAYLVIDGFDRTRLQLQSSTLVALCW
jgi:hypothetical protein